jgi:hypothetical protein
MGWIIDDLELEEITTKVRDRIIIRDTHREADFKVYELARGCHS